LPFLTLFDQRGRKVSDRFTFPICRLHHRELHRRATSMLGGRQGVDALAMAATLWRRTHPVSPLADLAGDVHLPASVNGKRVGHIVGIENNETKPIHRRRQNDILPANRGQPPQRPA
jgi:hypothetical protein